MRIIYAGTPDISAAVLETLLATEHDVIACLTQPDRPQGRGLKLSQSAVKTVAIQNNINVLQPVNLKDLTIQQELTKLQPDIMIVLAYGIILPQAVLDIPQYGCINIHASILPRWRGAAPIQHAILAGDKQTGITIMQMDKGMDTGDILATYPCPIQTNETSATLYQILTNLAQTSITDALPKLVAGKLHPIKQTETSVTYAAKIDKQHAKINWQLSAVEIDRQIRAYNPWPIAFTTFDSQIVRIWNAEVIDSDIHTQMPGTIVAIDKCGIDVATGDGILRISNMQFPGKKVLHAAEIYHAHTELQAGACFV